jgi:hypothetical protein
LLRADDIKLLEQLVASLLGSSILLQDYDNMYQICQQPLTAWEQAVQKKIVDKL